MAIVVAAFDEPPRAVAGAGAPARPSARLVAGPTMPSTTSPLRAWKSSTARRVFGPKSPSAVMPSARWTARTSSPVFPRSSSWAAAGTAGTATVAASSAADTCTFVTRLWLCARRRRERSSDRSHNSTLARSRSIPA